MPTTADLRRPHISSPFGPVKSSKGPDLIRSNTFMVVDGIGDCKRMGATDSPARSKTRRISASFPNVETPCASPKADKSSIIATASTVSAKNTKKIRAWKNPSLLGVSLKPLIKTSSTYTLLAAAEGSENVPPMTMEEGEEKKEPEGRLLSKLPKSRTMARLQGLKKSISRQTLVNRSTNIEVPRQPSVNKVSSFRKLTKADLESASSASENHSTASTPSTSASFCSVSETSNVDAAQSSAYWTGRFVALHDRLSSEAIPNAGKSSPGRSFDTMSSSRLPMRTPKLLQSADNKLANLKQSNTTMALTAFQSNEMGPNQNEDSKCLRIFKELDSNCTTTAAKESLHAWQFAYARRQRRPKLVPEGYSLAPSYSKSRLLRPGRISGSSNFAAPMVRRQSTPRVSSSTCQLASTPCRMAKVY